MVETTCTDGGGSGGDDLWRQWWRRPVAAGVESVMQQLQSLRICSKTFRLCLFFQRRISREEEIKIIRKVKLMLFFYLFKNKENDFTIDQKMKLVKIYNRIK